MHAGSHDRVELSVEEPEAFETRSLDSDGAIVPEFEVFRAARARLLASVAAPQSTTVETSDGPRR